MTTLVEGIPIQSEHERACQAISAYAYQYFQERKLDVENWHFEAAIGSKIGADKATTCMTITASKPGVGRIAFTHTEPDGTVCARELAIE